MLSYILDFIEGPLLQIVFYLLIIGVAVRLFFFLGRMVTSPFNARRAVPWPKTVFNLVRALLPLHSVFPKNPVYALLRYLFHISLFVVPIWFSGHVNMWEESSWELYYEPIPDEWISALTLVVIGLALIFTLRRMVLPHIRRDTSSADYVIIAVTAAPFVTGYCLTHGTLDQFLFFEQYMWYFHLASGEAMLLMIVFLFCRTRLRTDKCVGCGACQINCPTSTLDWEDQRGERIFTYSQYQCICCANCVKACPESAAELRHEIGIGYFLQVFSRKIIRKVDLNRCSQCGIYFAPSPQVAKLDALMTQNSAQNECMTYCQRCKKLFWFNKLKRT